VKHVSVVGSPDAAAVARMTEAQQSRGPDGSGHWDGGWVVLGHRRLSLIDLSDGGRQPMVSTGLGVAVSFNGCVYNYRELRTELEQDGYGFSSSSDSEVVLAAYHRWGERFAEHLVGMLAVAVVDRIRRRLVLARNRLDIKPLYVTQSPQRIRFASAGQRRTSTAHRSATTNGGSRACSSSGCRPTGSADAGTPARWRRSCGTSGAPSAHRVCSSGRVSRSPPARTVTPSSRAAGSSPETAGNSRGLDATLSPAGPMTA
jgi:hypothetical protein